jgi:hypothetical protein
MPVDITYEEVRRVSTTISLEDLSINDTGFLHGNFCIDNEMLYMPGWSVVQDLAGSQYDASGIMYQARVLPGRKVELRVVDAAQAQKVARGFISAEKTLDDKSFNERILSMIENLFRSSFFGSRACAAADRDNPLRDIVLFSVESINGHARMSDLLASAIGN